MSPGDARPGYNNRRRRESPYRRQNSAPHWLTAAELPVRRIPVLQFLCRHRRHHTSAVQSAGVDHGLISQEYRHGWEI